MLAVLSAVRHQQRISLRPEGTVTQPGHIKHQRHHRKLTQPEEPLVPTDASVDIF